MKSIYEEEDDDIGTKKSANERKFDEEPEMEPVVESKGDESNKRKKREAEQNTNFSGNKSYLKQVSSY